MSKPNQYGYSIQMNQKLKRIAESYSPKDVSEITALRNKKPLWHLNTIKPLLLKGKSEPLSEKEIINVSLTLLAVIVGLWLLFNL